jgi:hypothetical protein
MAYTEEQIRKMSYDDRMDLALNPYASGDVLNILAKDADEDIRSTVAGHSNTPREALLLLAKDEKLAVRWELSDNPNIPAEALYFLAKDEYIRTRFCVARNPNATEQVLVRVFEYERRLKTPLVDILKTIIANANCPDYLKAVIQTTLEGK